MNDLTKTLGYGSVFYTIIIAALFSQMFLFLIEQVIKKLINILPERSKKTTVLRISYIVCTIAVLSVTFVFIQNIADYLPASRIEANYISKTPLTCGSKYYILYPITVFGVSLLTRIIKNFVAHLIINKEVPKEVIKPMHLIYPSITGIWSFTLPVGISVYWVAKNIFELIFSVISIKLKNNNRSGNNSDAENKTAKNAS